MINENGIPFDYVSFEKCGSFVRARIVHMQRIFIPDMWNIYLIFHTEEGNRSSSFYVLFEYKIECCSFALLLASAKHFHHFDTFSISRNHLDKPDPVQNLVSKLEYFLIPKCQICWMRVLIIWCRNRDWPRFHILKIEKYMSKLYAENLANHFYLNGIDNGNTHWYLSLKVFTVDVETKPEKTKINANLHL